jgi:streptolysin S family bacteriocin protoxin
MCHFGVCRLQKGTIVLANNLLIAKFPQPSSHTSNTVDKLNKSKLSGLVNVFTLVLPLVCWWCCCCCLSLAMDNGEFDHGGGGGGGGGPVAVAAAAVVAMDGDWW